MANPEQLAQLVEDPSKIPLAVEEMLRWVTPIKNMARTALVDIELRGVTIPAGDEILLVYPSGNRDEEVFDDPERFDISRTPNDHIAFGFGTHFCLGNQLARMELRCMLEQIVARMPDLHRVGETPVKRRDANFVSGIESLEIEFTPGPRVGAGPA